MKNCSLLALIGWLAAGNLLAAGVDWYRWRGPDLNGISQESAWRSQWPAEGPKRLWTAQVGIGFASFSVSSNRVFTTGNANDHDTVFCFDAGTGKILWRHTYPHPLDPRYYEGGTSATPTVDGARVYTLSKRGHLFCLDVATGKVIWQKHLTKDFGMKMPEWGFASSPLVWGDLLLLNAGTAGLAVNKNNGQKVWDNGTDACGYSSVVPFNEDGQTRIAVLSAKTLFVLNPQTGREAWRFPWETKYDVNAADPIISGNRLFLSSSYGKGCALIEFNAGQVRQVYANKYMRNHFNSCVLLNGHLYGTTGESGQASYLMCMEWATGQVKWQERSVGLGALMAAEGKLIVQGEKGELLIVQATPEKFTPLARAQVLRGRCWTTPVLSQGRIYCRNAAGQVVALDVRQ